jgi:hypothetical protein
MNLVFFTNKNLLEDEAGEGDARSAIPSGQSGREHEMDHVFIQERGNSVNTKWACNNAYKYT